MVPGARLSAADKRVWLIIAGIVLLGALFIPLSLVLFDLRFTYTVRVVALGGAILGLLSGVLAVSPCCVKRACWAMRCPTQPCPVWRWHFCLLVGS